VTVLLQLACGHFPSGVIADSVAQDLHAFILDRLKPYLRDQGFELDEVDALLSLQPTRFDQLVPRLRALQAFRLLPEAEALAAANKRIRNILRQAGFVDGLSVDPGLLREPAEQHLARDIESLRREVEPIYARADFTAALKRLAALRPTVDAFFDQVMVMADDPQVRQNRLALLSSLGQLFLGTADISRLQPRQG
jgi:glycyl-tRNA synthetase beta chain